MSFVYPRKCFLNTINYSYVPNNYGCQHFDWYRLIDISSSTWFVWLNNIEADVNTSPKESHLIRGFFGI